jgi:predicted metal-dependent HD superfamily phosphohydrolase
MKINNEVVNESSRYVSDYLAKNLDSKFTYHNLSHTMYVVKAVEMLCSGMKINNHERKKLLVAAWFHDLGYTQQIVNHETAGASIAEKFLLEKNIDQEDIADIKSCILSTHYPQKPTSRLEEILCDADMMHLSDKAFIDAAVLLRSEWELTKNRKYTDDEWCTLNIQFLSTHQYHTAFAKKNLEGHKNKNIKRLTSRLDSITEEEIDKKEMQLIAFDKQKRNKERLERGVETLFRTASSNHMKLSGMADNKAHILLSINSIIISIILSVLAKKIAETSYLLIPTILLLCIAVTTIVFAVLTTKPKVSKGIFTVEQITKREVNLLFFGNFHQMELSKYEWAIQEMMYDKEYLYKSMTKDIYFLGKILAAKYRYLNIGYRIFMYGLLASVAAYGISFLFAIHMSHP